MSSHNSPGANLHYPKAAERCEVCHTRRWYSENGFRYCKNGHQLEGFIELDVDEADNYGEIGAKTTRKAGRDSKAAPIYLAGSAAKELFLECMQLVLRLQISWLIRELGQPALLENVSRSLWDLRIRHNAGLHSNLESPTGAVPTSQSVQDPKQSTESVWFSSQAQNPELAADILTQKGNQPQRPDGLSSLPSIKQCLAICYMACLTLSLPLRIGDLVRWASVGRLPFLDLLRYLPRDMLRELPRAYRANFAGHMMRLDDGSLHHVVQDLMHDYTLKYGISFPHPNTPLLLLQYTRDLSLPADVYVRARAILKLLLQYQGVGDSVRNNLLIDAEIRLAACLVVATRLALPDNDPRQTLLVCDQAQTSLVFDWKMWRSTIITNSSAYPDHSRPGFNDLAPEKVWTMADSDIEAYLGWFRATQINESDAAGHQTFFLEQMNSSQHPHHMDSARDSDERHPQIAELLQREGDECMHERRKSDQYYALRKSSLTASPNLGLLYSAVASYAGLSIPVLLKAVRGLERRSKIWQLHQDIVH